MDLDSLKRVAREDPEALRRWLDALSEEDRQLLDELLREFEARFWKDLSDLKNDINSKPEPTAKDLADMEARARNLGTCERVMVLALRFYRHRLLGELMAAEEILSEAWKLVPSCRSAEPSRPSPCLLELQWRRGMLDWSLGQPQKGLVRVQECLDGYHALGHAGHNLDGDGVAGMTLARAEIRFHLEDYAGSAADFSFCLDRYQSETKVWMNTQQNLVWALSRTGPEGRKRAYALLERQRLVMRRKGVTVPRASFLWSDGQLAFFLGKQRGRKKLREALDCFEELGMPYEYWAVALDIARILYPRRDKIEEFLKEIEPIFKALVRDERHARLFNELKALCEGCPKPTTLPTLDSLLRRVREMLTSEAAVPPCLLVSPA